ncbi:hypothetical protein EUGRSUZ_B02290 [Eucalyptus grandis]|uniref:Uncharacterized protein n=2 Tax=Eucalyptus grandis TaxID=71139 RepID=A0ACC3LUB9_EUCGR|nr:hypothetical protein EUGRSUZ_B02290 [Eucalyptus grandis]
MKIGTANLPASCPMITNFKNSYFCVGQKTQQSIFTYTHEENLLPFHIQPKNFQFANNNNEKHSTINQVRYKSRSIHCKCSFS